MRYFHWLGAGHLLWIVFLGLTGRAEDLAVPVTTRTDAAGMLLRQWYEEGRAAGHTGDFYDNRDGRHSSLDLAKYPQLQPLPYTNEQRGKKEDFGPAAEIRPVTVLGNASLSGPAVSGVSIPRLYYGSKEGLGFLTTQYLGNHLYIYPEHQDHDPVGGEGSGWGDLYPANSPCLVISQGSSYSDQPFLDAFAMTMASFPPDLKKEIKDRRLLFPVLQYLFRASLKPLQSPEDYLTGLAHPSVFPADWINEEKMMRMAQEMTRETLPPVLLLEVVEESQPPRPGVDFFEAAGRESESLSDRGAVIARVFRGMAGKREMRVRVASSFDWKGRLLKLEWRLLRGDPERVRIEPSFLGTEAKISVSYQPEAMPVPGQRGMTSRRIDIGVFAGNGQTYSPPVIISFYFLPNERRTYDEASGRILAVDYDFDGAFVDVLLSAKKPWRDVYHYHKTTGEPMGWRREEKGKNPVEFDAEGRRVGPAGPEPVRYEMDPATSQLLQKNAG